MKATLRALSTFLCMALLLALSTKALGAKSKAPNRCENALLGHFATPSSEEEVFKATLFSTSQHGQKNEVFLTLKTESGKLFQGIFRSYKTSHQEELPNPKVGYAVFLLDEFFGRPAKVPLHTPYVLRGDGGILELTPPPSQKNFQVLKNEHRHQVYDIALLDFLVGIEGRQRSSLLHTEGGLSPQGYYWLAFRTKITDTPFEKRAAEFSYIKEIWKKASPEFKNQILNYEKTYLAEDIKEALTEEQLEDIWLRSLFLRHLDARLLK